MIRIKGYKWKNVNVSIDIRDIDTVNENVVKLLKEVKNHRNFEEEDRDMIARFEKDLNTKMSYVDYYTRLLQIEKTLKSEKERLDKNISYYRGFPF